MGEHKDECSIGDSLVDTVVLFVRRGFRVLIIMLEWSQFMTYGESMMCMKIVDHIFKVKECIDSGSGIYIFGNDGVVPN